MSNEKTKKEKEYKEKLLKKVDTGGELPDDDDERTGGELPDNDDEGK